MSPGLRVGRNAIFNLAGGAVPAILALLTIPFIVRGLGEAGFGVLTLITAIVGYFALLDINVTAGSVKYLAAFNSNGDQAGINQTVGFGLAIYLGIGILGGLGIFAFSGLLIERVLQIPVELQGTAKVSLQIAALGFALSQMQMYLQSIPQALLRYDLTSKLEMSFGIAIPLGTVGLVGLGYGLVEIVSFRVLASAANCCLLWSIVRGLIPALRLSWPGRATLHGLIEFSAFSFLSRIAAVTYAHADKLIIGAMVGVKELAYYTIAATLANRVLGLMFRVSAVLFPTASSLVAQGRTTELERLYIKATRYIGFLNGAILIMVAAFAEPILTVWIGADFAARGTLILQLIALAQFVDSLTNLPSLVNDGMGHPRVSGSFALLRALIGLALLYFLVGAWGINGAAWAHLYASALMTSVFLVFVHGRTVPCSLRLLLTQGYAVPMGVIAVVGIPTTYAVIAAGPHIRTLIPIMVLAIFALSVLGVSMVLGAIDRAALVRQARQFLSRFS